ncbi:Hsp20 family protein [Pseudoalteromonas sp. C2R02]|uniref:Hsp20 family protein n=1 Tax=Pseudoalteromonas sp. C2R02 TaxID=2841565 RepID=UPI001C08ADAC|nr:Hsp20 family protein [Pseudoalteromonas sp. C2R02]MBU2972330.1 Hsp20 family protein [Pseudoalteromonas sp. C2R02]
MRTVNFAPLNRSFIGFDQLTSLIDAANSSENKSAFPRYNIEQVAENQYQITIAVAGFTESELAIESENNSLKVTGTKAKNDEVERNFIHQGIAERNFERKFQLGDHVKVLSADIENGLLFVDLEREVPEEMKPRQIEISSKALLNS